MISFIVPAHNEEAFLGRTLQAICEAVCDIGQPYEVLVVDDASTDATADVARQHGARVVSVDHRQIAATRNSGARAASGERLFFVDADTMINPRVVGSALREMDRGAAGGGAPPRLEGPVPLYMRVVVVWFNLIMRLVGITGGACMFCTRAAFQAVGGFDERLFGAEDAALSLALKREGRYVVLWSHVLTSGRRTRGVHGFRILGALVLTAFFPKMLKQRSSVEKIWYDSDRETGGIGHDSLAIRLANIIALAIVVLIVTGPIWILPWPQSLLDGPLGTVKFAANIIGLHVGLLLLPCAYFLFRSLIRQTRWVERIKLGTLTALCVWLGWENLVELVRFWTWVFCGLAA